MLCALVKAEGEAESRRRVVGAKLCAFVGNSRDAGDVNHLFKLRLEASALECRRGSTSTTDMEPFSLSLAHNGHIHSFYGCKRKT